VLVIRLLEGIRVLELGNFISGPFAGQLLAEMGAEILKIERPDGGDPFRGHSSEMISPEFSAYNRGKRSITVDLNTPPGRDVLLRLVDNADVLLDNFRPDVMGRFGLGFDVLHERNPSLIYCNISGFGPDGPYAKRPAYDTVAQSMSGFFSQSLDPERPRIAGPAMADAITGLYAALGIASALAGRGKNGKGHRLDVAMVEVMAAFTTDSLTQFFANGVAPSPYRRASLSQSFALRCADGKLVGLHLSSPEKFWDSLLVAIQRPDIGRDARFSNREGRVKNFDALCDVLGQVFIQLPRAEWESRLLKQDVPYAPIYSLPEVEKDPQIVYLQTFYSAEHPQRGRTREIQGPIWCDRKREVPELRPPSLGQHTEEQLRRANFTDEQIADLRMRGAI
jgi:crotonobetainyl-CoA:carnitine CoA-transferase CaiB-like acyl-CoA transferase